jgi:hypothetical protein
MSYIGAQPTTAAFVTDTFSANGSGTVFTLSVAPANTNSILVAVSGVLQDPSTYSVSGTTLTFSAAPPAGTGNISVRFLGIPASGVTSTAYRTQTEFTATAGQTTFSVPSYTVGYIDVYRNGAKLGTADFTATNGTTVVLASGASSGDLIQTVSFYVSSVLNAIPAVANAVTTSYINSGAVTAAKMAASGAWAPTGTVVQVVQGTTTTQVSTTGITLVDTGLSVSITPLFSTSKILVMVDQSSVGKANADERVKIVLLRNSSQIATLTELAAYTASSQNNDIGSVTISYLDSPATTSATTYKTQFSTVNGVGSAIVQWNPSTSTITAMEITA